MADKRLNLIVDLINKTEAGFKKVYSDLEATEKRTENMTRAMKEIGVIGGAAFAGLSVATKKFLGDAAELEQQQISFETMLGSAEAAAKMLQELSDFASKTPFELQGIRGTAKQLMAMGIESDKIIPTMKALGDVSAGLSVDLDRIAYNYGQVKTQTKLTGVELKDFMRAGIPLLGALADVLETSEEKVKEMVTAGQVGFPVVEEAFRRMTSEGGQFENLMFKQSASLSGMLSNLNDNITRMSEVIGTALLPVAKELTDKFIEITEKITAWVEKNPELAATILKISLAVTALMASMGLLGLILPRIILGFGLAQSAAIGFGKGLLALGNGMAAAITMSAKFITALGKKETYIMIADKATKAYSASTLFLSNAFKTALASSTLFGKGLGILKLTLASTGIGAIILLVGYLAMKFMELSDTVGGVGNAIKLFWAEFKVNTLAGIKAFLEGIAKVLNALPGVDNALGDSIETIGWLKDAAEEDSAAVATAIATTGMAATIAADEIDTSVTDIGGSFELLTSDSEEAAKAAEEYFKSLVEAVKSVREEIADAYGEISDATDKFNKSMGAEQVSYENDVVSAVSNAYEKKKQLEQELRDARKKDDNKEEVTRLKESIAEQEEIIESYKDLNLDLDKEIAENRKRLGMDEIERLTFDHEKKLELIKKEYLESQIASLKKILVLQTEHATIMSMTTAQERAKIESEIRQTASFRQRLAQEQAGLTTWLAQSQNMYTKYVADVNKTLGGIKSVTTTTKSGSGSSHRATGGPVQPGRTFLVGEKGPELFSPDTYGRIAANGSVGGGVTIVFQGNHFTDDNYAREIQNKIVQSFKRASKNSIV